MVEAEIEKLGQLWTEKYRPSKLKEVLGSAKNIDNIIDWANSFKGGSKPHFPGLLMVGPPGIGKTTSAIALAKDYDWSITEFNASDLRTHDMLMKEVAPLTMTQSFKGAVFRKMFLLDEVDSLHGENGKPDRSAGKAIQFILSHTKHPIILTCNDDYPVDNKIKDMCVIVKWSRMRDSTIRKIMLNILKKEGLTFPVDQVNGCIAPGDMRASITNLQVLATTKIPVIHYDNAEVNKFNYIQQVFRCDDINKLIKTPTPTDLTPENLILWIAQNAPLFYRGVELVYAYDQISIADIYLSLSKQTQDYQYWRLAVQHMTIGVALSRRRPISTNYIKIQFPSFLKKMSSAKDKNRTIWRKGALAHKLGGLFHMSPYSMMSTTFPLIQKLCMDNIMYLLELKLLLDLNENELSSILDTTPQDPRIKRLMSPEFELSTETEAIIERQENKQKSVLTFFR